MRRTVLVLAAFVLIAACLGAVAAEARPVTWPTFGAPAIAAPGAPAMPAAIDPTTAVNPRLVEFTPSSDHDVISPLEGALVTRYELRVYLQAAQATPVVVQDLAKPAPNAEGRIAVDLDPVNLIAKLALDTLYVARVAAIGPRGQGVSGLSNPFGYADTAPPGAPSVVTVKK